MNKVIPGFNGMYEITKDGKVWSNYSNKYLKPDDNGKGYKIVHLQYQLHPKKLYRTLYIHRLVAQAFIPNPDNKSQVNHIDGNKSNNDITNLEWATPKENMLHAFSTGLTPKRQSYIPYNDAVQLINKVLQDEIIDTDKILSDYNYKHNSTSNIYKRLRQVAKELNVLHDFNNKLVSTIKFNNRKTNLSSMVKVYGIHCITGEKTEIFESLAAAGRFCNRSAANIKNAIIKNSYSGNYYWYKA